LPAAATASARERNPPITAEIEQHQY